MFETTTPILTPLLVGERDPIEFDYASLLLPGESVTAAALSCERINGAADATPEATLQGIPLISSDATKVYQYVTGRLPKIVYGLRCTATIAGAGSRTLVLTAYLPVVRY